MAMLIEGKKVAQIMQEKLKQEVAKATFTPHLVVIIVGHHHASEIYVRNKKKAAEKVGFLSTIKALPSDISQEELVHWVQFYNNDSSVDGILVQLPLPSHIDEYVVIESIDPKKDVDGFHPYNMGRLVEGKETLYPSTPYGILSLLDYYRISVEGKHAVVVGRSNIVGKPIAQLLLQRNATVTVTHSKTKQLSHYTKQADILIVAVGKHHFIKQEDVKQGAVVIDVGMNRDENGKLSGDVDFDQVKKRASFITPVPKGVGPMTITSLLQQTFQAALRRRKEK